MNIQKDVTLVFLIKKNEGVINEICLAMKKRGFGAGRWNGAGGKKEKATETLEACAIRESKEELGVIVHDLEKVAELMFIFTQNHEHDQCGHVYITENWESTPTETEEMRPQWFSVRNIPYEEMWSDDIFWLPHVLKGNCVKATFWFDSDHQLERKKVSVMDTLDIHSTK